ncbi:hypothetical protein PGTUg99_000320 [Puccinia graminis f. sp. tritici]|uniref:Uncharacterized protein n=1 Tax=Puccinia graminis f. sp. tritici TaxID=56615 RepID=A0A5B0S9G5_PUCGR|nr:hypothetical protein PGTUg99_000320 [Puccinia graminis f. sp. tritici]
MFDKAVLNPSRRPSKLEHSIRWTIPFPSTSDHPPEGWSSTGDPHQATDGARQMERSKEFVEVILTLDLKRSTAENSRLEITPYWATSLLEALVFGIYNLKRQQSKGDSESTSDRLPVDCIFRFVERFLDQHPEHQIKANTRILLNCLRVSDLPPAL